jgi:hypothetical protein
MDGALVRRDEMIRLLPRNAWAALPVAWLFFFAISLLVKQISSALPAGPAWRSQAILKGALLAFAVTAAVVQGIELRRVGFCRPEHAVWGRALAGGFLLGAVTTLVVMVSGVRGLRSVLGGYSFGAMVLWVWIVSSVSEEVFCRGWFQTSTMSDTSRATLLALLPSAILFGSLHLLLVSADVDVASVAVVVIATTLLGLLAAWARATSASLYPAIAAHVAFNVGGAAGGIVYAIGYAVMTGKVPDMPGPKG